MDMMTPIPVEARAARTALALLSLSVLSGCMSGLALVTSPDIAKLEKKADHYMVMETDVEIEGKVETIKAEWRCFQSPSFSANAGWYMRWQGDPSVAYVAKALPSGKYLVTGMGSVYCPNQKSGEIEHGQNVGLLDATSSTLEIFSNREYRKPHDNRIKRSIIRVISAPEKIERVPGELAVAEQFLKENASYATVLVNVWDAKVWEKDLAVKARIEHLAMLTYASDLNYHVGADKGYAFGNFADHEGLLPGYTKLPIIDGKLNFTDNELTKPGRRIFGRTPNMGRGHENFEFCYYGHCRQVKIGSGSRDQIYDPTTKRIIQISWPITSIGRNLNELLE